MFNNSIADHHKPRLLLNLRPSQSSAPSSIEPNLKRVLAEATPSHRADLKIQLDQGIEKLQHKVYRPHIQALCQLRSQLDKNTFMTEGERGVKLSSHTTFSGPERASLKENLLSFKPWRKGPFDFHGIPLEAEWDSDQKWKRLSPHLGSLWGKKICDVGCNNGYYLLRMAAQDPKWALGIDPTPRFYLQWLMLTAGLKLPRTEFQMLGVEHLVAFPNVFDIVFSMGIVYHHPDPIEQLSWIKTCLRPGGTLVIESMGIDHPEAFCLFPQERYAKAPGVWFLPSQSCLENWLLRAGFRDTKVLHSGPTTEEEQRNTEFCPRPFETLKDFLKPGDRSQTVEGYPAPHRHMILAKA